MQNALVLYVSYLKRSARAERDIVQLDFSIFMCENCRDTECIIKQTLPNKEIDLDLLLEKLVEIEKRPLKIQEEFERKIKYLTNDKHTHNLAKLEKI